MVFNIVFSKIVVQTHLFLYALPPPNPLDSLKVESSSQGISLESKGIQIKNSQWKEDSTHLMKFKVP
jgi:hypothetical protein